MNERFGCENTILIGVYANKTLFFLVEKGLFCRFVVIIRTVKNRVMKQKSLSFFFIFFALNLFGQTWPFGNEVKNKFIPVSVNAPIFGQNEVVKVDAVASNYGFNLSIVGKRKDKFVLISLQSDILHFDPFRIKMDSRYERYSKEPLIADYPKKMLYGEAGIGYDFKWGSKSVNLMGGVGQQFENPNTRFFAQFSMGQNGKLIDAGFSLRANVTRVNDRLITILEPVILGKVKIGSFRLVHQFGYAVIVVRGEDYGRPILSFGLEYVIGKSNKHRQA